MPNISEFSIIEKGAKIAKDVKIGPYCYIGPKVKIGSGCVIENNVTIVGNTTIGSDCYIFPMCVIGTSPEGNDSKAKCTIGNANSIREHVTIYGGTTKKPTIIGQHNLIMISSQVGSSTQIGDHSIFANCTHIASGAKIEDYVRTSAFGYIDRNMTVGAYAFTAGYVHVDSDVPPYAMVQGSPYRVRGVNSHNLKACGFGDEDIRALKRAFRDLYNGKGALLPQELAKLSKQNDLNTSVRKLIKEIKASRSRKAKLIRARRAEEQKNG